MKLKTLFWKIKKLKEELEISFMLVKYQILKFDANSVKTMKKTNKLLKLVNGGRGLRNVKLELVELVSKLEGVGVAFWKKCELAN